MTIVGFSGLPAAVAFKRRRLPGLDDREYRIAQGFDAAAALVAEDGVVAAAAEERFTRDKGTGAFPAQAIRFCLASAGVDARGVDALAHGFDYRPYRDLFYADAYTRAQYDDVFAPESLAAIVRGHEDLAPLADRLVPVPHHLAHAASAFYPSGFDDALILVADGSGEIHSLTAAVGSGDDIRVVRQYPATQSLGLLYGLVTHHLGFKCGRDEYKVMGLAAYGDRARYFAEWMDVIRLGDDGRIDIPALADNATIEEKETYRGTLRALARRFGAARLPETPIEDRHRDVAAGLQAALEAALLHVLRYFRDTLGQRHLCLAGGVALNCAANGVIQRSRLFRRMYVQPAAGDDGTALGAALYTYRQRAGAAPPRGRALPLYGPAYSTECVAAAIRAHGRGDWREYETSDALIDETARRLARGEIVGWFQGEMEYGPRALGNRSILADPRDPAMRDRINARVKKREQFRPFAPAALADAAPRFFDIVPGALAEYETMLVVVRTRREFRDQLPAVTHVDGSARLQIVAPDHHPKFAALIEQFGTLTGIPVLLNTSLNVRGEPIACSPRDALRSFESAGLDALAIDRFLVTPGGGGS